LPSMTALQGYPENSLRPSINIRRTAVSPPNWILRNITWVFCGPL
jgi:hypothetical protein